ncbi:unnamed protein product [Paramecium octaurelia]|uniref:Uncharacterized protein n=1 Tax=Paramecium octaurelia TaxID=43137 RepID=A0A8S1TTY7_PAROT|nr:unnamed protein product [Paramecium octaurelia]
MYQEQRTHINFITLILYDVIQNGELRIILTKRIDIEISLLILTLGVLWYRIIEILTQQQMDYHQYYSPNITIPDTWTDYLEKFSKSENILKCLILIILRIKVYRQNNS